MHSIRLLKNGSEIFPALFAALDRAASSLALEMYIFSDDGTGREFRDRLVSAARRGVQVRVLVDAVGSWSLPEGFWDDLAAAGGRVKVFRPVLRGMFLFRNHRKLLVADERLAYLGGMNVADEYFRGREGEAPWRDNALEVSGDAVRHLAASFERMWALADLPFLRTAVTAFSGSGDGRRAARNVQFLESGPGDQRQPVHRAYRSIISTAVRSIDLSMGYFYPNGRILRSLKRAVQRGVRVRLLVPQRSDVVLARWAARGLYGRLLRAGMEVWEYRPSMLHAKLAVIDDIVIAGSANLDIRSSRINHELVAVVHDGDLARQARDDFAMDLELADRVTLDAWSRRPWHQRITERISYWLLARLDIFIARAELARMMR